MTSIWKIADIAILSVQEPRYRELLVYPCAHGADGKAGESMLPALSAGGSGDVSFFYLYFSVLSNFCEMCRFTLNMRNTYALLFFWNLFSSRNVSNSCFFCQPLPSPLVGFLLGLLFTHLFGAQRGPLSHRWLPSP